MAVMHSGIGRSNDALCFNICHLGKPQLLPLVGPSSCFMFSAILRGGKTMKVGWLYSSCMLCLMCIRPFSSTNFTLPSRWHCVLQNGRVQYVTFIRSKVDAMCPAGALARLLWWRFVNGSSVFPMPDVDWDKFLSTPLFALADATEAMSYDTLATYVKQVFRANNVVIAKVCHAFRHAGARFLDQCGWVHCCVYRVL